jgi:hypothetical protein
VSWFRRSLQQSRDPSEAPDEDVAKRLESDRSRHKCFTPFEYYKFLRREIKREDKLTHQRITWSMQFQGFLVAAMAVLISSQDWTGKMEPRIGVLRLLALPALGAALPGSRRVGNCPG